MSETASEEELKAIREAFVRCLYDDVTEAQKCLAQQDSQFNRRNFVRVLYSVVEGFISLMKSDALFIGQGRGHDFSLAELAMLREESYTLDASGRPGTQQKFIPTDANFRFAVEALIRQLNPSFKIDVGGNGWQAFKAGLAIRHRITHPKIVNALVVTDDEMQTLRLAQEWFHRTAIGEHAKAVLAILDEIDRLKKVAAALQKKIAEANAERPSPSA